MAILQNIKEYKGTKISIKKKKTTHTFLLLTEKRKKKFHHQILEAFGQTRSPDLAQWSIGSPLGTCWVTVACVASNQNAHLQKVCCYKFSPVNSGSDSTSNYILTGDLGRIYQSKEFMLHMYRSAVDRHTSCVMSRHIDITSKNVPFTTYKVFISS